MSKISETSISSEWASAKARNILKDLEADTSERDDQSWDRLECDKRSLPSPYMVFLILVELLELPYRYKPLEKTLWEIPVRFKGVPLCLAHRKFGFSIHTPSVKQGLEILDDLIVALNRMLPTTDSAFAPIVEEQIREGKVMMENSFHRLDNKYDFFRSLAEEAFRSNPPPPKVIQRAKGMEGWDLFKPEREGYYFATAMLDAFFSRLEHLLVLMLPFCDFDPARDDLPLFIKSTWTTQFKRVFRLDLDHEAKSLYEELRVIKECFRNFAAHGELEKGHGSLFVTFPRLGAIPANLSLFGQSPHFSLFPLEEISFKEACTLFDRVDHHFSQSHTRFGYKYVEAGLPVAFDRHSIEKCQKATVSEEEFNSFLEYKGSLLDRNVNMDW